MKYDFILHMGDSNFMEINWMNNTTIVGRKHLAAKFLEKIMAIFCSNMKQNQQDIEGKQ